MRTSHAWAQKRPNVDSNVHTPSRYRGSVSALVRRLAPAGPLYVFYPDKIRKAALRFLSAFPGRTMYAVKTNPHPLVLETIRKAGVKAFDAASIAEVRLARSVAPEAEIFFMHPVKAPEAIREAYYQHGVRNFVLDSATELKKILRETGNSADLTLFVRLSLPDNDHAAIDFSVKFGAPPDQAAHLLLECRKVARKVGLCFHVGSQTLDSGAWVRAIKVSGEVTRTSGIMPDILDIGGGFPAAYPDQMPFALEGCFANLKAALAQEGFENAELLAEPGRALVAEGASLVARVELRKGNTLYLNDGTYGGLFDAGPVLNARFETVGIRKGGWFGSEKQEFALAGPTCDSIDMMKGPFILPIDIGEGDWVEFRNMGAYSYGMRTDFNGFGQASTVCLYEHSSSKRKERKI